MSPRPGRLNPSKILWPTIHGFLLLAVIANVLVLIGAWP